MKNVLYDGLVGLLFFGGLSYISDTFKDKAYYFKLIAFLWAAPFTYFYLLYITSRSGKKALNGFNTHALIGTIATAVLILNYMLLKESFEINQINASGIITASSFSGDGSSLTGVTQSDTPIASSTPSTVFYESDDEKTISEDTTLSRASSNSGVIYTKFQQIVIAPTKSLIVDAGETLVVDVYGMRTPDI